MGALTREERRRIYLARQEVTRQGLARLSAPIAVGESERARGRLRAAVTAAMLTALLGTGLFVYRVVEFHMPASIDDALPLR